MVDTEKITINLGVVDLGQIDLLVEHGLYSNRTDLIRTAIRNQITRHATVLDQAVTRRAMAIGVIGYSRSNLQKYQEKGERLDIKIIGMLHLSDNITPELALATINSITVRGVFNASKEVKEALADRIL